jgi:hypothetical protein
MQRDTRESIRICLATRNHDPLRIDRIDELRTDRSNGATTGRDDHGRSQPALRSLGLRGELGRFGSIQAIGDQKRRIASEVDTQCARSAGPSERLELDAIPTPSSVGGTGLHATVGARPFTTADHAIDGQGGQ